MFCMLYAFFWVIPRRLKFICRRIGTLFLFHLHRQVDESRMSTHIYLPMKMEQTECSETSEYKLQTPRNYPKESIQQGNLCLLWQHCRRPWSFTCKPCSFDSGGIGFVWVIRVWDGSADPKSRQMRSAFRHTIFQRKRWMFSANSQTNCCCLW
jgi:hypothetical protein